MEIKWKIKPFAALSAAELYQSLKLRSDVFIIEQNCIYPDIDGKDQKALHLLGEYAGSVQAYARIFRPGDYFAEASIGRVVVSAEFRSRKWGHELMESAIEAIGEQFGAQPIVISAQLYLKSFYESHGFVGQGEPYLEDDIPHLRMQRD